MLVKNATTSSVIKSGPSMAARLGLWLQQAVINPVGIQH